MDEQTYEIVRYYAPHLKREPTVIKTGVSLEEAQEHCNDEDTHGIDWFDGYRRE